MGEQFIQLPADSSGKKLRTRERVIGANTIEEQYVLAYPPHDRVASYRGMVAGFAVPGSAATPQNIWSIENASASTVNVALRDLSVGVASTAVGTARDPILALYRITAMPTGGTVLTKVGTDTTPDAGTGSASVIVRSGASADGTASAITATAAGGRIWAEYANRLHTLAGQTMTGPIELTSQIFEEAPLILRPGQAFILQVITAAAADNIATRLFLVSAAWEEFTWP